MTTVINCPELPEVRVRINSTQAAKLRGCSLSTLNREILENKLPTPHYIERKKFWYLDEFEACITKRIIAESTQKKETLIGGEAA